MLFENSLNYYVKNPTFVINIIVIAILNFKMWKNGLRNFVIQI